MNGAVDAIMHIIHTPFSTNYLMNKNIVVIIIPEKQGDKGFISGIGQKIAFDPPLVGFKNYDAFYDSFTNALLDMNSPIEMAIVMSNDSFHDHTFRKALAFQVLEDAELLLRSFGHSLDITVHVVSAMTMR